MERFVLNMDFVVHSHMSYEELVLSTQHDSFIDGTVYLDLEGAAFNFNINELLDIDWHDNSPDHHYVGSILTVVKTDSLISASRILQTLRDFLFKEIQGIIVLNTKDGVHSGQVAIMTGAQHNEKSH